MDLLHEVLPLPAEMVEHVIHCGQLLWCVPHEMYEEITRCSACGTPICSGSRRCTLDCCIYCPPCGEERYCFGINTVFCWSDVVYPDRDHCNWEWWCNHHCVRCESNLCCCRHCVTIVHEKGNLRLSWCFDCWKAEKKRIKEWNGVY
jgi:hypothetical protein